MRQSLPLLLSLAGIAVLAVAMVFGPLASPPEFTWIGHTTSEQAGQGMPGAWIMRAGFVAFGVGTALAAVAQRGGMPWVRAALAVFGAGMVATAVWSNASILPGVASDMTEDRMHSIASGLVGTAFAAACAARLFSPGGSVRDPLAIVGLAASVILPMSMDLWPEARGLLQRIMFAISFAFIAREFGAFRRPA